MKVIDLLNKIANGEEKPKKVSINAGIHGIDTWVYDEHYEDYKNGADVMLLDSGMTTNHLNDEVEIIEEDKKIGKLYLNDEYLFSNNLSKEFTREDRRLLDSNFETIRQKFNEIIDYINKGDK